MSSEAIGKSQLSCQSDPELVKAVRLLAWLTKSFEAICPQSGISLAKYRVLLLVSAEPVRVTELANHARVSLPTLSGLVASLERQGLLERTVLHSDRRGVVLRLTPAGLEARTRAEETLARQLLNVVESAEGDDSLRSAVGALATALDRSIERGLASGRIAPPTD
jgi:DNA-binding MarR family transcriptional regulator